MLTDKQCKSAECPADKKRKRFTDSGGLYLEVSPTGSKRWFWKTYMDGKEGRMALGSYPSVSLAEARTARVKAKLQKDDGVNPVLHRKIQKLKASTNTGDTFKDVSTEWYQKRAPQLSASHSSRTWRQLERDLFPWIGQRRLADIEPVELLAALRKTEQRGAIETADRGLMICRQVWAYGISTGRVTHNVTDNLKAALTPYRGSHFAAITEPKKLGELLRAIQAYHGGHVVRAALQLAPILFQRPNELRAATWAEFDLKAALWTIPAARMKREKHGKEYGDPHLVPLPRQAVSILKELHQVTGHGQYAFPGERSHERPISDNSVRTALISMGYSSKVHTWHGFRATARTLLAEVLEADPLVIEAQLAHAVKDANGRAYNRTQYLKQRTVMMQKWANYLDNLQENSASSN